MAADNEIRIISRAVRDADFSPIFERGVLPTWFFDPECRDVYEWCVKHIDKYGAPPTAVTLKDNWPTFRLLKVSDPLPYLLDQLVAYNRRMSAIDTIREAADHVEDGDHEAAIAVLASGVTKVEHYSPTPIRLSDLTKDTSSRWDAYDTRKSGGGGLIGLGSGYATIDRATLGFSPQQLVTFVASPKAGKTTVSLCAAIHAHEAHAASVLYWSFEMSASEIEQRHDAIRAKISHSRLRGGSLEPDEEDRFRDMLADLPGRPTFTIADAASGSTISALRTKIDKLVPDLIVVDGVYLMTDEVTGEMNSPQALTNITRGLKRLAQQVDRPVVITTQALLQKMVKKRLAQSSIGYSSSFLQDSDVTLGLEEVEGDEYVRTLKVLASRNCGYEEITINFDYEHGDFSEVV